MALLHNDFSGTYFYKTLLEHMRQKNNAEVLRLVNSKSRLYNETALHAAAAQLNLKNVKLLLEYGADVNAKMSNGETPLALIPMEKNFKHSKEREEADNKALAIVKVLLAAGAVFTDSASKKLMTRCLLMYGNREMVHTLLQGPIDWNFMDGFGDTFLHVLAYNKHPDILEEVQDLESASKVRSVHGFTMLHRAAQSGNVNAIKHLLNSGADVNAEDNLKKTPLSLLFDVHGFPGGRTLNDYLNSVEILLEHGAHPRLEPWSSKIDRLKDKYDLLSEPVLSRIALLEASGQSVESLLDDKTKSCYASQKTFDSMKQLLADMKEIVIGESVTLLDFLIASDEKISFYARNKRLIIANLTKHVEKDSLDSYYRRLLRKQFTKFSQLFETRKKAAIAVNEVFNQLYNISVYTVAERIVNYLEDQEMYKLLSIFE